MEEKYRRKNGPNKKQNNNSVLIRNGKYFIIPMLYVFLNMKVIISIQ